MYTKRELLKHFDNPHAIAVFLQTAGIPITHQAVYAWPMDEPVPKLRGYQLKELEGRWRKRRKA